MKGADRELSIGERVAFYRRRRGLTQVALAGLVGRTESWVEKIEHGRAALDRISVVRELAGALDVSLHDLLPDDLDPVEPDGHGQSVPALRELVLSYRAVNPRFALLDRDVAAPGVSELRSMVDDVWTAYQDSRFGYAVMRLNQILPLAYLATREAEDVHADQCLAYLYHAAASVLVKLGNLDLARVCADRGDIAAQETGDPITLASLQRSIAHTLLSNGQYQDAVGVVREGVIDASALTGPAGLSVTGTLMLVGATASARAGERAEAMTFLRHADQLADRLGADRNEVWTSFGPTNVAIHRVTVAAELGDVQLAVELGSAMDVTAMPRERRIRHQLEVARALSRIGRRDESLQTLLSAEHGAPDQVRRHFLTHELVHAWMRTTRTRPSGDLVALARRLGHAA
jgi:transcriptional regulator with XRE-family HTH domain